MKRASKSNVIIAGGIAASVVLWLLDSLVEYVTSVHDLTFFEMVFFPPLHAAFARSLLAFAILAFSWASSRAIVVLERKRDRIEHLNSVLRSIRSVNRLLVNEDDVETLLQDACRLLTEGRGYDVAWIAHMRDDGTVTRLYSEGLGEVHDRFGAALSEGCRPPCFAGAKGERGAIVMSDRDEGCEGCPIGLRGRERAAVVAPMQYSGQLMGVVGVTIPRRLASDQEEARLAQEIAGDLAMRIHGIETEEELEQLIRFREAIIDQANTAVVVFNPQGRVVVWNRAAQEMTGYGPDEIMGKNAWHRVLADEEAVADTRQMLQAAMLDGRDFTHVETPIRAADGDEILISWHARRLSDEEGRTMGAVAMGRDVTEQRRLERRLARSQRMEAVGRLAGGVAHDFNNMLTAIIGNAQLLEAQAENDEFTARLSDIRRAGERSAKLTRQLLTFSRQVPTEPRVFDLNTIVREMQSMLDRLTREHTAVEVCLTDESAPVLAEWSQMEQVVMNLTVNARDAMPEGGTITIRTQRQEIGSERAESMTQLSTGPCAVLIVSDTGEGMDEKTLAKAFEPFFTTRDEGTGLGLATTYGIVQGAGGEIEITSTPGEGTTVTVYLPIAQEQAEAPAGTGEAAGDSQTAAEGRVLLAEDEEQVRRLIAGVLRRNGYQVIEAGSGEEALAAFSETDDPMDLLLTDVVMGGMGGVELAAALRREHPELPVLFISGYSDIELPEDARLLQKPFLPEDLLATVGDVLRVEGR